MLITPLLFRSVAARLNISNDIGSVAAEVDGSGSIGVTRCGTAGGDLAICSFSTKTGGNIGSSEEGGGCRGTATAFLAFCNTRSDNMGNKECKVGIFSFNDGIDFSKFPIVEEVKEVFLLYQMKRMPMTKAHKPTATKRANINFGDNVKGYFLSMFPRTFLNTSIGMVGNFNILAFSNLISSGVRVAKSVLCHIRNLLTLV